MEEEKNLQFEEFKKNVTTFIESKYYQAKVIQIEQCKNSEHKFYFKFSHNSDVWFQPFNPKFEIDSIDFKKNIISGFIYLSSDFKIK